MADNRAKKLIEDFREMQNARRTWESKWQEITELVLPQRSFTSAFSPGAERRDRLFDSTPVFANEMFASQLGGQLINPALQWFGLRFPDNELNEDDDSSRWLALVRDDLMRVFNAPSSAFHPQMHEMFLEEGAFGNGAFFVGEKPNDIVFTARPLAEMYVRQDDEAKIDAAVRKFELTARQAAQFYGQDNLPDQLKKAVTKEPNRKFEFIQFVHRREDADPNKADARNKPWASIHIALQDEAIILESGFSEFPFMFPRWFRAPSELYGRGPGMTTLPDNRMLQRMKEVTIRGAQKVIDPPLIAPDDGLIGPIRTTPGGINIQRVGLRKDDQLRQMEIGARPDLGEQLMETVRHDILRAFFVDPGAFRPPEPRVTATAVMDNRDARFQRMTPMIARMQSELLAPLIDRVFAIRQRQGHLPEPPDNVPDGTPLDVEFVSPAAMAQMVTEADNMSRFLARIAPLLEADPAAIENLDVEKYVQKMGKNLTVPPEILRDPDEAREAREGRRQQLGQAELLGQLKTGAEASVSLTEALQNARAGQGESS